MAMNDKMGVIEYKPDNTFAGFTVDTSKFYYSNNAESGLQAQSLSHQGEVCKKEKPQGVCCPTKPIDQTKA